MIEDGKADSERRLKVKVTAQDNFVTILFQDSGPGIKEPHRIFEPFYTTKSIGKGTGLGLASVMDWLKNMAAKFPLAMPMEAARLLRSSCPPPATQLQLPYRQLFRVPRNMKDALDGRILVVEDEESVLEFERDVLEGAGAKVVDRTSL